MYCIWKYVLFCCFFPPHPIMNSSELAWKVTSALSQGFQHYSALWWRLLYINHAVLKTVLTRNNILFETIPSVNVFPGSLWLRYASVCLCCLWVSLWQNASQNANYTFFSPQSIYDENVWSPVYMFLSSGSRGKEPFVMHSVSSLKVTAWWVCFYVSVLLPFFLSR